MTKLDKPLKRELSIEGAAYVLTIAPDRFRLILKGHRKGLELAWRDLVNGEAALATALNASLSRQNLALSTGRSQASRPVRRQRG